MEKSVKKLIDGMIDQAKVESEKLTEQRNAEGQITLPQVLADGEWTNNEGEEFGMSIVLDKSVTALGRLMGMTSLDFYTFFDGKFVKDIYMAGRFGHFAETVASEEFLKETEKFIGKLTADDGNEMKTRIRNQGTFAIQSFIVPETIQMRTLQLPKVCTLSVGGTVFEEVDAIKEYVRTQTDSSRPYIIERSQRFPCFDASDYAYENRYYRNFLICSSKQEADMKLKDMKHLEAGSNFCLVNMNLPATMRPMVYYQDESASMLLAC